MALAFQEELLERYTDLELAHYIASSPSCTSSSRVFNLSSNLIAKIYRTSEVEDALKATEVASQLVIRGPSVRKVLKNRGRAYTIMDRVEGTTLDVVWKELSWFMTIKLGLQLRRFVKILRSVTSPTAGSLTTGECRSFWLEDRYGLPANSGSAAFAHFFRFWTNFTSIASDASIKATSISPSGQLSLLDWDLAGFYPVTFEYASMYNFNISEDWGLMARLRWHLFVWIGVGYHETDARLLRIMRSRFTRFAVGRRYELLEKGGPTRYPVA
ncbi:hypothetical protein AFLA_005584 [Aspergillus flavus NRRL3357]|nr:hypothetical protein AFLA_005584 [Aspergillus flavus NRRL3357]